jgi:hypothetical protein
VEIISQKTNGRKEINLEMSLGDMWDIMSEGRVSTKRLLESLWLSIGEPSAVLLGELDDMNIRGEQIEIAFNYCNREIGTFMRLIASRDLRMIAHVNNIGRKGNHVYKAVRRAAQLVGRPKFFGDKEKEVIQK